MYHAMNNNRLYDMVEEREILVELFKDKDKYDIMKFIDDITTWIDHNREYISDNYLPLAVCSIGMMPTALSAYLFGFFVGKAIEKHKMEVKISENKMTKDEMMDKIEQESIFPFNDEIFGGYGFTKDGDTNDKEEKEPRK